MISLLRRELLSNAVIGFSFATLLLFVPWSLQLGLQIRYNKIPRYPIFYLLKGDYRAWGLVRNEGTRTRQSLVPNPSRTILTSHSPHLLLSARQLGLSIWIFEFYILFLELAVWGMRFAVLVQGFEFGGLFAFEVSCFWMRSVRFPFLRVAPQ